MARNQFMTKKWDIEKLMTKREGLIHNCVCGPRDSQERSRSMLDEVEEAIRLREGRGEKWERYFSRDAQDYVYNGRK
jgi:hypothetical protein